MLRELDERTGDDLRVTLYWQDDDTLVIKVEDFKSPERAHTLIAIPPADAKIAFEHPFAYRPSGACCQRSRQRRPTGPDVGLTPRLHARTARARMVAEALLA